MPPIFGDRSGRGTSPVSRDHTPNSIGLGRRGLLRLGVAGAVGGLAAALAACGSDDSGDAEPRRDPDASGDPSRDPAPSGRGSGNGGGGRPKVFVAFFSRAGENYYYGDRTWLDVGNTEVVVRMIPELIECDVHEIRAADPYPEEYDACVARNSREQDDDARPEIADDLPDITAYDVVILASPIWNVRAPMIMTTFTEALDFEGKTVHPLTTHAMSGLGRTENDYAESCAGASIGEGLAIQGEEAGDARPALSQWLRRIGLDRGR